MSAASNSRDQVTADARKVQRRKNIGGIWREVGRLQLDLLSQATGGVTSHPGRESHHYTTSPLTQALGADPSREMEIIGDWAHPRRQQMLAFTRRR